MKALRSVCWVLLVCWLTACPLMWILRDGLGPDSVETSGWAAVMKFWPMLAIGLLLGVALLLLRKKNDKQFEPLRK